MFNELSQEKIEEAIKCEYESACNTYGADFNSTHEAYAVMCEEMEEASEEVAMLEGHFSKCWKAVKSDDVEEFLLHADEIAATAEMAMLELAQVVAVCKKAKTSGPIVRW